MIIPSTIIWIFTAKCNLNCIHCYTSRFIKLKELTLDEKLRFIDEISELGISHVGLSGGEPLLHPHLPLILSRLRDYGISISMVTNAIHVTPEKAKLLYKHEVYVYVSIDGPKHVHEKIRGIGTFDKTINGYKVLKEHGVEISTVMAINKLNYKYIEDYFKIAMNLEVDRIAVIPVMPSGRALTNKIYVDAWEYLHAVKTLDKLSDMYGYPSSLWCTPFAPLIVKSRHIASYFCRTYSVQDIDPAGRLLACDVIDLAFSNIRDKKFIEALREYQENKTIKEIVSPSRIPKPCLTCPLKEQCRSGCFARSLIVFNGLNEGDPLCPRIAEEKIKKT